MLDGGGGGATSNVGFLPTRGVPLISWVQAGQFSKISDPFQPGDADEWLQCPARHSGKSYALTVRGTSMYAPGGDQSFKEGDRIFVDPERDAHHRSLVIARLDDEAEATFKQLLIEGNQRFLQALNPNWPNRIIPIDGNCTICGVVIGKWESFA
jgi:SOS-response transcriptional repressor LexA